MRKIETIEHLEKTGIFIELFHIILLGIMSILILVSLIGVVTSNIEIESLIQFDNFILFLFSIVICHLSCEFLYKYTTEIESTNKTYQVNKNDIIKISLNKNITNKYQVNYITILINNKKYQIKSPHFIFLQNSSSFAFLTFAKYKYKYFNKKLIIDKFFISTEFNQLIEEKQKAEYHNIIINKGGL